MSREQNIHNDIFRFFPYKFCTEANLDYDGVLPPLSYYYDEQYGKADHRIALDAWHAIESERYKDGGWNLKQQLIDNCKNVSKTLT